MFQKLKYGHMVFWVFIFLSVPLIYAENPEPDKKNDLPGLRLDDVVVTAKQTGKYGIGIEPSVTIIDINDFPVSGRQQTVLDLLGQISAIDVMRADHALSDERDVVKIRGLGGRRIMVRIDGRPVRSAGGFGDTLVDWTALTLEGIQKIEVLRGGHSAVYGETLGGTINIITKKSGYNPIDLSVTGDYADYNTRYSSGTISGKNENSGYVLAGSIRSSDGYLKNSNYTIRDFAGRLSWEFPFSGRLSLGYKVSDQDKHLYTVNDPKWPGYDTSHPIIPVEAFGSLFSANFSGGQDRYDRTTRYADLIYTQPWHLGDIRFHLYLTHEQRNAIVHRFSGVSFYDYLWDVSYEDIGWVFQNEFMGGKNHKFIIGIEGRNSYGDYAMASPFRSGGSDRGKWVEYLAGYLEDSWRLTDHLNLTAGVRYDRVGMNLGFSDFEDLIEEWSPKSTLNWQMGINTIGFACISKAFRVPTAMEYGWLEFPTGANLRNETALEYETGIIRHFGKDNTLRVTGYLYDIDNYIVINEALPPSAAIATGRSVDESVFNADYLKLWGIEMELDFIVTDNLSGYFNYTWQKTRLGSIRVNEDEARIDAGMLPKHKANFDLRWHPFENTEFSTNMRFADKRKITEKEYMDRFITVDLAVRQFFRNKKIIAKAYVINLFNKNYQESYLVPAPDRCFGVRFTFTL